MSPSGHVYLLTIALILPTRGQTLKGTTPASPTDSTAVNIHALAETPVTAIQTETQTQHSEVDVLLTTAPRMNDSNGEAILSAGSTEGTTASKQPPDQGQDNTTRTALKTTGTTVAVSAEPTKGTTASKRYPDQDTTTHTALRITDSSEDDPFFYDEATLRKKGLLVAAVLFITGIVILTSGKCRQLPRLCRKRNGGYRILTKTQAEREDTSEAEVGADGLSPLPSQPCPPRRLPGSPGTPPLR